MTNTTLEKWEEKTLGEVCEIISGTTPDTSNDEFWGKGNYWITPAEINENSLYINSTARTITDKAVEYCSLRRMPRGTVLFSSRAPIGKIAISNVDSLYCNQGFKNFICSKNIHNKFLYYFLLKSRKYLISLGKGATFKEVSKSIISTVNIQYPPLPEQERIVAKLDKSFEAIDKVKANAEQNLNNAKELYKVVLNRVFNSNKYQFEHIKLDDLCEIITDGTHQTPTYADKGVIFLSAKNVTSEVIDWENIKYIPDSLHNELKKRVSPQKGDILLAKNGTTGVAAIVDRDCVFDIYVSLCMLRPKKTVNVQYLLLAINNPITKDKFNKSLIGIGVPNLHLNKIRETTVPIPSPKFQDEISSLLNGLKAEYLKLEQIYTQKIKECDELKQSILQKAFRGEL